jgi:hypothetical protein
MLFHSNVKAHVYKSVRQKVFTHHLAVMFERTGKYCKRNHSYINVSANDDINSKKAETNL